MAARGLESESGRAARRRRGGFTLIELLVVITIILMVTAITIPAVIHASRERITSLAAQEIQGALTVARDKASSDGTQVGIRFLVDPTFDPRLANGQIDPTRAVASNRWIGLETPPPYTEGFVSAYPGFPYPASVTAGIPALILEESPGHWVSGGGGWTYVMNEPTNWWWNVRIGDRVAIGFTDYVIIGPDVDPDSAQGFVNYGPPGTQSPISRVLTAPDGVTEVTITPEYLMLVNGRDDNQDGFPDNGWDGIDNDGDDLIDELDEWEVETWPTNLPSPSNARYKVARKPVASGGTHQMSSGAVVDMTTWTTTRERSRVAMDVGTGAVDVLFDPDGKIHINTPYAVRSSMPMRQAYTHIWVADRSDVVNPVVVSGQANLLPLSDDLKGNPWIVSVDPNGKIIVNQPSPSNAADLSAPFRYAEQR